MVNVLTRAYNSTIGVPQQFLFRLIRALKDDEIDVFSREGVLAPELLPILGLGFSHETDATIQDVIGEGHGFGIDLAADIFLDPATYLTAGATGIAKAARATQLASRGGKLGGKGSKAAADQFSNFVGTELSKDYKTGGDLANKIAEGLGSGAIQGKHAKRALAELEKFQDIPLSEILASGRKEELLLALPGLARLGAQWRAPERFREQKSWFGILNNFVYKQKFGAARPIDYTIAQIAQAGRNLGPTGETFIRSLEALMKSPKAFASGWRNPKLSTVKATLKDVQKGYDEAAQFNVDNGIFKDQAAKIDIDNFRGRLDKEIARSETVEDALRTTLRSTQGGKLKGDKVDDFIESVMLDEVLDADLAVDHIRSFKEVSRAADDTVAASVTPVGLREKVKTPDEFTGHPVSRMMWQVGDKLSNGWRKGFISDIPIKSDHLTKWDKVRKSIEGAAVASSNNSVPIIRDAKARISKATGVPIETLDNALLYEKQAFYHPSELAINMRAVNSSNIESSQAGARQFGEYIGRLHAGAKGIIAYLGVKDLDELTNLFGSERAQILGFQAEKLGMGFRNATKVVAQGLRGNAAKPLIGRPINSLNLEELKTLRIATKDPIQRAKINQLEKTIASGERSIVAESLVQLSKPTRNGKPAEAGSLTEALYEYVTAISDINRAVKVARKSGRGVYINPLTVSKLDRAQVMISDATRGSFREALKGADPKDIDTILAYSNRAAEQGAKINYFERGAPIGFLARQSNKAYSAALAKIVGKAVQKLPGNAEVASMHRRSIKRNMIVQDINELDDLLKQANAPELRKALKEHVGEIDNLRYTESWEAGVLGQLSQQGAQVASRVSINGVYSNAEAAAKDGLVGGRITRIFNATHDELELPLKETTIRTGKAAVIRTKNIVEDTTPRYIEVVGPDGKYRPIDLRVLEGQNLSIHSFGDKGDTLGDAVVMFDGVNGGKPANVPLAVGGWVTTGQDAVMQSLRQAVIPQRSDMQAIMTAYDTVNFGIKRFQTVYRFSHHAGNLLAGLAQTHATGVSIASNVRGQWYAARIMLGAGPEGRELTKGLMANANIEAQIKFTGIGKAANRVEQFQALLAGKTLDELVEIGTFTNATGTHGILEIVDRANSRNLYGSIQATEDIKLGGISAAQVQKAVKADKGLFTRNLAALDNATRFPEITARTATLFALLDEGHSLDDAIDLALIAHVDYSDLTKFERNGMKRAVPFYTFSRKYVPFALDRIAKDPTLVSHWQKTIEQSGWMGIDENGKPIISVGAFEADLGRVNSNIDAMMAVAGMADVISSSMSSEIQQVERPGFLSASGGALSPALTAMGIGTDEGASVPRGVQELWDSTFATKFISATAESIQTKTFQPVADAGLSFLFPARFNAEPKKARQFQLNLARRVLRRLELQAGEARSQAQLDNLRQQARDLRFAVETVQSDFK